ncbi:hypothetical protein CHS0354_023740 [Potamilus streckersoni]|uniref:MurNAc-LAA domain-containing protein n=1 Tax=Potamilus streckersoni TaxID=2493646 RepID=A0AAE0RZ05_9BIVA|nr:hypothetical protein CHS0354_023740 [Potamilus streckersoni]
MEVQGTYSEELNLIKLSFAKTTPDLPPTMQLNQLIDYKVETKANGVLIDFNFSRDSPKFEYIKSNKESTSYLTIAQSSLTDELLFSKTFKKSYPIKSIQPILLPQSIIQFTIEFNTKEFKILSSSATLSKPNQIRIQVNFKSDIKSIYESEQRASQTQHLVDERQKWNLDVITLDAGHGGKDPGANGSTGLLEKNVSLAISLKLAQILKEQFPHIKIIFTRDTDKFVPLDERGKIANEHQSKLFISLHCNASSNISAYGVEVYLLGLHKTEAALAIAERENSVINAEVDFKTRYESYTEENLITLTMAQNAFITQSHSLAELVHSEITFNTGQQPRGVRQAGFMVLWTPSMPSILVETGYITNKDEEKFLASEEGQNKIAQSIANAIAKYKNKYEAQ